MSFADILCDELAGLPVKRPCCRRSFVSGLLFGAEESETGELRVTYTREHVATLLSELLPVTYSLHPTVETRGRCGRYYHSLTFSSPAVKKLLRRMHAPDASTEALPLSESCRACRAAFLRGVLLAVGTVNDPQKSLHMEFLLPEGRGEHLLTAFFALLGYTPRTRKTAKGVGVYFKEGEAVEELTALCGSHHAIYQIIECRIKSQIRNQENRATNCVAKNIEKTIAAAARQMEAIDRLLETGKLNNLPESLVTTAMLRYNNPDVTLDELTRLHTPPISKSGLNHRLQKIIEAAEDL